ncbi:hypothetical protein ACROYT_G011351 [Oculina patagonica]
MADTLDVISLNNMTRLLEMRVPQNPTRYHTIPRFVLQSLKLQPRSFPFNLPTGPHRPTSGMSRPPALGLGNIRGLKDKRKKDLTAQEPSSNLPPIKGKEKEKEKKQLSFSPQMDYREAPADEEEIVPLPSHEKNADLVRYRAVRNEREPGIWQKIACVWDQFQTRPNQCHQYESDSLFPAIPTSTERMEENQELGSEKGVQETIGMPKMQETGDKKNVQFTRPTPGYKGYVSRYPVEPRPPQGSWDEVFVNFSKLTYRYYPPYEYTKKEFAHKGPVSRLVTTTHPFNPFNKVDKWNSRPKKLCKRANHSKFV